MSTKKLELDRLSPVHLVVRSGVWKYRFKGWPSGVYRTTGLRDDGTSKTAKAAHDMALAEWRKDDGLRTGTLLMSSYSARFYTDECPHCEALIADGGRIGDRSREIQRSIIKVNLLPLSIMKKRVCDVTTTDAELAKREIVKSVRARLAKRFDDEELPAISRTAYSANQILRTILSQAYKDGLIPKDPLRGVSPIKFKAEQRPALAPDQTSELFKPENWPSELAYAVFRFTYLSGMRRGEVLAFQWQQVRTRTVRRPDGSTAKEQYLAVDRAWKNYQFTDIGLPKWDKMREIPMTTPMREFLEWWKKKNPFDHEELLFHGPGGAPLPHQWWNGEFRKAKEAAGITGKITPHSLRHTITADLMAAGVPVPAIEAMNGWSTAEMIARYGQSHMDASRTMGPLEEGFAKINSK